MRLLPPLRLALLAAVATLPLQVGAAEQGVITKFGNYPTFGRIAIRFPLGSACTAGQDGDRALIRCPAGGAMTDPGRTPRNVTYFETGPGELRLILAPGARLRQQRVRTLLLVDVLDPPRGGQAASPAGGTQPAPVADGGRPDAWAALRVPPGAPGTTGAAGAERTSGPPNPSEPAGISRTQGGGAASRPVAGAARGSDRPAGEGVPAAPPRPAGQRQLPDPSAARGRQDGTSMLPAATAPVPSSEPAGADVQPAWAAPRAPVQAAETPRESGHPDAAGPLSGPASVHAAGQAPAAPPETAPSDAEAPAGEAARPPAPSRPASASPVSIAARRVAVPASLLAALPAGTAASAALLPFGPETGAAAFRRGGQVLAVFDERRPIDLTALRDDRLLGAAVIQLLPGATMLRLPADAATELRLSRVPQGWTVVALRASPPFLPISLLPDGARVKLRLDAPGMVVAVPDPDSGGTLLVGTQRGPASGAGLTVARRVPGIALAATWRGIALEPVSDRVTLRPVAEGFVLGLEGGQIAFSAPTAEADLAARAAKLTRRFDFPDLPADALLRRLQDQVAAAAAEPPLGRSEARRRAAQAMVALGMGAEAQALLQLAASEDAQLAEDPAAMGLAAVAALLAGRTDEADAIVDPRLDGSDEVKLWRAVRAVEQRADTPAVPAGAAPDAAPTAPAVPPGAASAFAATLPLILSYPPALRSHLLPLAAETMAEAGAMDAAAAVVEQRPDDPALAYARALMLAGKGDTDAALTQLDALAQGRDRLMRARALELSAELRIAAGRLSDVAGADALERQFLAWRGDGRELRLRLRAAALRAHAGEWRRSLTLLREADTALPDVQDRIRAAARGVLSDLLCCGKADAVPPLEFVALAEENASLIGMADETRLAPLLADKLTALDLPQRAGPVLETLMRAATGSARAELGERLARMRLDEGDPKAALAALRNSAPEADPVPAPLAASRGLLEARALARAGYLPRALDLLAALDTQDAVALRARLLEDAQDWPGAQAALKALAARAVPASGTLDEAQRQILLRLASVAAQGGDVGELRRLRQQEGKRMEGGRTGETFQLLTAEAVKGPADLPRAAAELAQMRELPGVTSR